VTALVERLLAGDPRALARGISIVEADASGAADLLRAVFRSTGRATVLGLTGPPGAGKSSLADRLIEEFRGRGARVGVIAVDPSSTFSGGAILGDRVRMQRHATDPNVFIRSMATRGHLGGLSRATNDAIDLLDAAGFDPILVETVGVGQDEVDVVRTADQVAVILVPGMGDDIQAIKAGILEIADRFVINKADRPGADRLEADLDYMMSLTEVRDGPRPTIHRTIAVEGQGVAEVARVLYDEGGDEDRRAARREERARARLLSLLTERTMSRVLQKALGEGELDQLVVRIAARETDPYTAVDRVLARLEVR